jgi:Flp pilus assembly protein TadG
MIGRRFLHDTRGTSAVEFALVTPLVILFLLGLFDSGFYAWRFNQTEKAAQMGLRYAVVTNSVSSDLNTATYVGDTHCTPNPLTAGDTICAAALGRLTCGSASCRCDAAPCPGTARDAAAFANVAKRIRAFAPWVQNQNIEIEYTGSGLGFAGDPNGMSIQPIVGVKLINVSTRPMTGLLFGAQLSLPNIIRSLPMEDGKGTQGN